MSACIQERDGSRYQSMYELTVTQPYEWCVKGRRHHWENFPYSFRPVLWVILHPLWFDSWKDDGDKANGLTSLPNDAIISIEKSQIKASMIWPVF